MAFNPLDTAWKIATGLHDRRAAEPSEIEYYRSTRFRNEIEDGAFDYFDSIATRIHEGWYVTDYDEGESRILRYAAYLNVIGFPHLSATLIKLYWLDHRIRHPRS